MADVLTVSDLRVRFRSAAPDRWAVDGVSFALAEGEILGLVGESGSGKTVTAMSVSGLLPRDGTEMTGSILLDGSQMVGATCQELRTIRGNKVSVVFQEPMTSLNPVLRIGPQVEESLRIHEKGLSKKERKAKALEALAMAELPDPEKVYRSYPHELSGGMLQRVMIAAAIVSRPRVLLADEPTTALDVTIQAQILELLKKLNRETGMSILFISHDLHVVRRLCSRVAVMQRGRLVETGDTNQVFYHPQHPYTQRLIAAIPTRDTKLY